MEQISLKAGAAGDSVIETGAWKLLRRRSAAPATESLGQPRRCASAYRPPDTESAGQLAAMLIALEEVRNAERFDDWVQAWVRAMEHRDAFTEAFAIAKGLSEQPAGSSTDKPEPQPVRRNLTEHDRSQQGDPQRHFQPPHSTIKVVFLHPCRRVKTPPVPTKPRVIVTPEQFEAIYEATTSHQDQLLVETAIESTAVGSWSSFTRPILLCPRGC